MRYLPVSTPRPSGDQGSTPRPSAAARRQHLALDAALQQGVLHLRRDQRGASRPGLLEGRRLRGLPAASSSRCRRSAPARSRPRGRRAASVSSSGDVVAPGVHLPQVDVVGAEPLQRAVQRVEQRAPRRCRRRVRRYDGRCPPWWRARRPRGRRPRRAAAPITSLGLAVAVAAAVSSSVPPASTNALSWSARLVLVGVASPGHRAEAEPGDLQARPAEHPLLHGAETGYPGQVAPAESPLASRAMRLGVNLGYWGAGNDADNLALARGGRAARLLRRLGRRGLRVRRGDRARLDRRADLDASTSARRSSRSRRRTPALTAMTAATLDTLSGGRFRLGLGVSGPQVSEGWHGVRFDKPLGAHPGVRRDRPARRWPARRCSTTASTAPCRCPTAPARRCASPCTRHASTSRSTWRPSVRRTSS